MHEYNPYCDMLLWPTPDLPTICEEANLSSVTMAFLVADPAMESLCWGGQPSYPIDWMKAQGEALKDAGRFFDVSIGGATGRDIAAGLDVDRTSQAYLAVMKTLGPGVIDFDIEGAAVVDTRQHQCRLDAMHLANQSFGSRYPYSVTLAVMPDGLTADGLRLIDMCKESEIGMPDEVRIMAMDYGSSFVDMGVDAINAAEAAASQVGMPVTVVPMIGQNDIKAEVFSLADAQMLADYAEDHPEVVAGLSAWSLGRDRACRKIADTGEMLSGHNGVMASAICSGVKQEPYEFSGILGSVGNGPADPDEPL